MGRVEFETVEDIEQFCVEHGIMCKDGLVDRVALEANADRGGLFTDPHTGVALAALGKLAARGLATKDEQVVVISTASGLKFTDFKVGYHTGTLAEVGGKYRNQPFELPDNYDAVRSALLRGMDAC